MKTNDATSVTCVWKWHWDCGRAGDLDGVFVATRKKVQAAIGKEAYFGEVLGKHSEVYGDLKEKEFKNLSSDPVVVAFVKEHGPFGRNPLSAVSVACDDCGDRMEEDDQVFKCTLCDETLCSSCAEDHKGPEHDVSEVTE